MNAKQSKNAFFRMFGSAVVIQAIISAGSFIVGLILLRRTSDVQYGYYVLIMNAVLLSTILQLAFIQPYLVASLTTATLTERAELIGSLHRSQRRLWPMILAVVLGVVIVLRLSGLSSNTTAILVLAAAVAVIATLYREFFRLILLSCRKPEEVLKVDAIYVILVIAGAFGASFTEAPAIVASLTLALAAAVGGFWLSRAAWRQEPWNRHSQRRVMREASKMGAWAAAGSATHWLFSQGYNYLIAGALSVSAVAAVAAARLPMMPINLLSTGIASLMLPTTSAWLQQHHGMIVYRRLALTALSLAGAALCYLSVLWYFRDWVFIDVFKKHFADRDRLLLLWSIVAVLMLFRDQLMYLLAARGRFRILWMLTLLSAFTSLTVSYLAMRQVGVVGALYGILTGEALNVLGIIVLSTGEALSYKAPVPVT